MSILCKQCFVPILSVFVSLSMASAFAGVGVPGTVPGKGGVGNVPETTASLNWEQFKDACQHPEQFHNQDPPSQIRIQCSDVHKEYVPTNPGQLSLPVTRKIVATVFSNKFHVDATARENAVTSKAGTCLRFKEVEKSMSLERTLTCDQVLGIKTELAEFCQEALDSSKNVDTRLINVKDTNNVIDTCGGPEGIQPISVTKNAE